MKTHSAKHAQALHLALTMPLGEVALAGDLDLPADVTGLVLFAHGSGSSRHSPRNQFIAQKIRDVGIGTLLFDLLTDEEEQRDAVSGALQFDVKRLARRLIEVTLWTQAQPETQGLKIGYFGASTGTAAALIAAAELGDEVAAIVSRGGRPDLAGETLPLVKSPTLLIVGGYDEMVICLNDDALARLRCRKSLRIITGATHLFEEPGKLEQVAQLSTDWFTQYLGGDA